jgi:hypothetical protein
MTISANFPNVQPSLLLDFANAKQLPPQVTFTRATTATYYDGSTTAKAEQNFVLYSQAFSNGTWGTTNATKTSTTTTDPAGGSTALTLAKTGSSDYSLRQTSITPSANKTFTVSCYLKGTAGETVKLFMDNAVDQTLISQTVTLTSSWVRYSGTGTFNSTAANVSCGVNFASGTTATSVDVAFFQVEERSSATAYTATTTQAITNYVPVLLTAGGGQPRFQHNPTTSESLGLLIEESRTNVLQKSGTLTSGSGDGNWNEYYGASFQTNVTIAPDGTQTASSMYPVTGGGAIGLSAYYSNGFAVTAGTTYTFSVYLKAGGISAIYLGLSTSGTNNLGSFDLSAGTLVGGTGTITSVGNGWYRCSVSQTPVSNGTFYPSINYTVQQSGATGNIFKNVFAWGAQVETGTFATSYIATTSASATRARDLAVMTGSNFTSWFNNSEGTVYFSGALNARRVAGFETVAIFTVGTSSSNSFGVGTEVSGNDVRAFVANGGATQADLRDGAPQLNTQFKGAFAYQANDFALCADNGTVQTDTTGTIPSPIDRVTFGVEPIGDSPYNGTINKFAYYPQRVTDVQVKALTS